MNFLEQLVAEWYELQGYFVRCNIKYGKRGKGGYEGEMDVAAYHPNCKEFVHVETSMDAESWGQRRANFRKKFKGASEHYPDLFGFEMLSEKKIAIVGFGKPRTEPDFGADIQVKSIPEFMREIVTRVREIDPKEENLPERLPLLRAIQFALFYGGEE